MSRDAAQLPSGSTPMAPVIMPDAASTSTPAGAEISAEQEIWSEAADGDVVEGASVDFEDATSASADGVGTATTSDDEEDSTAVNACKALLYAAANAVLFGVARLLHGTFTSY